MAKIRFSAEEDEKLIEMINSHEYLWDMAHCDFKNTIKKDEAWRKIGKFLNKTRPQCQKRWRSIRDHYRRQRKEENASTGSTAKKKRALYWDRLKFLDTAEHETDSFSNIPAVLSIKTDPETTSTQLDDDLSSNVDDSSLSRNQDEKPSCQPEQMSQPAVFGTLPRKRRRENSTIVKYLLGKRNDREHFDNFINELVKPEEQDEIDLFFKSMAMSVKKFRPELAAKTKMKILRIVTNMEILNQQTQFDNVNLRSQENNPSTSSESSSQSSYQSDISSDISI